jgi:hypothetical protein
MRVRLGRVVAMAAWAGLLAAGSEAAPPAPLDPEARMIASSPTTGSILMARAGAARRLANPRCAEVFREFVDDQGRPLQEKLDAYRLTGPEYLALIYFADGSDNGRCGDEVVLANTTPGSRHVAVCRRFARVYREDRTWAEVVVIHEALHTLGLGENPPTSFEISTRVASRCR